eukprot:gene2462-3172_t
MEGNNLTKSNFFNVNKLDISNLPLFKTLELIPYKQRIHLGTLYTFSSLEWHKDKPKLLSNILEGLKLKKEDIKELIGLLEVPTEEEEISIPPLELVGCKIEDDYKWIGIMCFLVLALINENEYDSRIRVTAMKMSVILKLKLNEFYDAEEELSIQLKKSLQEIEEISKEKKENIIPTLHRLALIGLGSFVGGVGLMFTGLVITPILLPAALGVIGLSSLAGSTIVLFGGPFIVAGLFGLSGSGLGGYMVKKRTDGLNQFQFQKIPIFKDEIDFEKVLENKNPLLDIEEINVEIDENLLIETESNDNLIHEDDLILTEKDEMLYKNIYTPKKDEKKNRCFVKEENDKLIIKEIKNEKIQLSKIDEILKLIQFEKSKENENLKKIIPPPITNEMKEEIEKEEEEIKDWIQVDTDQEFDDWITIPKQNPGLNLYIGISGFLKRNPKNESNQFWSVLRSQHKHGEVFNLDWENDLLYKLGYLIHNFVQSKAAGILKDIWIEATTALIVPSIYVLLKSIHFPIMAIRTFGFMNNPWNLGIDRANKAGKLLADVLISHVQGNRPVTLVGYSLGARVIFKCLEELGKQNKKGIIENVFLFGAPINCSKEIQWKRATSVVAGRFVNGYALTDWVLAFLYRCANLSFNVAGLQPCYEDLGVENIDLSKIIDGHHQYCDPLKMDKILKLVDIQRSCKVNVIEIL